MRKKSTHIHTKKGSITLQSKYLLGGDLMCAVDVDYIEEKQHVSKWYFETLICCMYFLCTYYCLFH
jgi:hypothetical protein